MASDIGNYYEIPKFLDDLLIEIFLRCSVETLLKAKCVCKRWYGLIRDSSFAYIHLQYQKRTKKNCFLLQYFELETRVLKYAILNDITQSSTTYRDICSLHLDNYPPDMEGPVDGLYCLHDTGERLVLWNPALMDFKILPLPPPHILPHYKVDFSYVGFGIDRMTNDHRVVLCRTFWNTLHDSNLDSHCFASVYSLRTDTWRNLDFSDFPLCDYSFGHNLFLDGTYYWWAYNHGVVIVFDFKNENFQVVPGPNISKLEKPYCCFSNTMAVCEERVALLRSDNLSVDIWVMLEAGIWIKQYSVGSFQRFIWPLDFWEKGGLILVINDSNTFEPFNTNSKIALYDINTQELRNVGPTAADLDFRTCVYCESLISMDGGTRCKLDQFKQVEDFFNKRH